MTTDDLRTAAIAARTTLDTLATAWDNHRSSCPTCRDHGPFWNCPTGAALHKEVLHGAHATCQALLEYAPPGTEVTYQGSQTQFHGPGWLVEGVTAQSLGSCYTIRRDEDWLSFVHVESIDLTS